MKKKLAIILIIITSLLISCSKASGNDAAAIKAPTNNNLSIYGTWRVENIYLLDKKNNTQESILEGDYIYISNNKFNFMNRVYTNPSYKLKVVDKSYILSYELNFTVEEFVSDNNTVDIISVVAENSIIAEFIIKENGETYIFTNEVLLKLSKVADNSGEIAKSNMIESESNEISSETKNDDVGVMLALNTPRKMEEDGDYTNDNYRTLWISFKDDKLQPIMQKDEVIFPRMNGIWKLNSEVLESNGYKYEYFNAVQLNSQITSNTVNNLNIKTNSYKRINFIANDYVAIEKYEGHDFKNIFPIYEVLPVDNLNSKEGVTIDELYSKEGSKVYNNNYQEKLNSLSDEERKGLKEEVDNSNFTLKRVDGKWNLIGKISALDKNNPGVDFKVTLNPSKKLLNYDTLMIPWKNLKSEVALIKDAFIAPTGKFAVIVFEKNLAIYEIKNNKINDAPIKTIELEEGEKIIMAEWCSGSYVESWAKAFKDGKKISGKES